MTAEPKEMTLGERTFLVPPLVLKYNMIAYPLCRKLSMSATNDKGERMPGCIERSLMAAGVLVADAGEMSDMAKAVFVAAQAADPDLTREEFDALAVTPPQLLDAILTVRYQTGGWRPVEPGEVQPGEAQGEDAATTSPSQTSKPSSQG